MIRLAVPGDKSISHRALILAALGSGRSRIRGLLRSADIASTAGVLRALGVGVPALDAPELLIEGVGLRGLRSPATPLDCGNSGTTARLLAGVIAGAGATARFTGDASLSARPMRRVAAPLEAMGARVELPAHGGLPMTVHGAALHGITWRPEVASAQVKGAILLAGLVADVPVEVDEPAPTRDHTERMLRARGVDVREDGTVVTLHPKARLDALDVTVPGDPSSAAFIAGLAAIGGTRGEIALEGVGVNPGRIGAFRVLQRMGARLDLAERRDEGGEPVATVVASSGPLRATTIAPEEVPSLIDELPLLACVAACAAGETRVTGAGELRVKESDRIRTVVGNLRAVGADADELPDGFVVRGISSPLRGSVATVGDHRIAMAFGILGARAGNAITVDDPSCADVSYPSFWHDLARLRHA
jgi:3-phosphoshikimate 1-carboxyvinyltransferase